MPQGWLDKHKTLFNCLFTARQIDNVCFPLIPAAGLGNAARGVTDRDPTSMEVTRPGACLSSTEIVASGVTSLAAKPVPPVVRMMSTWPPSDQDTRTLRMSSMLSGTHLVTVTSPSKLESSRTSCLRSGPDKSSASPLLQLSLTVRIPTLILTDIV